MGAEEFLQDSPKTITIENLKSEVLNLVAEDRFDDATGVLNLFLEQPSDFPQFKNRMERLVKHSIDLVNAIRAKKNFPGMNSLTRSKQQEIAEKTKDHFNELQITISKMERIMEQLKREDIRSTIWIIRSVIYASGIIVIVAFLKEITGGLWSVFEAVMSNFLDKTIDWIVHFF